MPQSSASTFRARWVLIAVLQPPSARSSAVGTLPGAPKMPADDAIYAMRLSASRLSDVRQMKLFVRRLKGTETASYAAGAHDQAH